VATATGLRSASFRRETTPGTWAPRVRGQPRLLLQDGLVAPEPKTPYVPNEMLGRLCGCRLFSVQFVMDYVQLRFDGPIDDNPVLNCDVMPIVERGTASIHDGELGYSDALRGLISGVVKSTREETGIGLRIEFEGGAIVIHPDRDDLIGPEIALLGGFVDGRWMCWRPGEESFEDLA